MRRQCLDGHTVGAIGAGLLILVCAERGDTDATGDKLLAKILKLRIFADEQGKMNKSVADPFRARTFSKVVPSVYFERHH